uniref:ABC-2 type transporter transmembrane domain-containing protein n=1 Tax=Panagrolaimus davidi TaxID=227884 RepID=A0A914P1B6_9BILA
MLFKSLCHFQTCVVYFLIGLQATAGKFFLFMFFMILCSISATSLALMISALCRTTDLSVTVLPMALEVFRLFGGFFLSPANLPKYFSWLDALSYVKYSYVGIALNELQGLKLSCEDTAPNANCIPDGETTIRTLGLDYINIGGCIGCLIGYIIICRTIAYFGVRFLKH